MIDRETEEFLESLKQRAASPHTVSNYQRDLRRFAGFIESRKTPLEAVDHILIRDFLNSLYLDGLAKSSVSRILSSVRSFFKFMVRRGQLPRNPGELVSSPKIPRKLPSKLSELEAQNLMELRGEPTLGNLRDHAILELLYASGLRVSELVGLNEADVDMSERVVRVRVLGKGQKERIVPFGQFAAQALEAYGIERALKGKTRRDDNGNLPVFINIRGSRLSSRSVERLLEHYRSYLPPGRQVTPHTLRHSFATHLLAEHDPAGRMIEAAADGFALDPCRKLAWRVVGIFLRRALDRGRVTDRPWIAHRYAFLVAFFSAPDGDQLDLARLGRAIGLLASPAHQLLLAHRHTGAIHPQIQRRRNRIVRWG